MQPIPYEDPANLFRVYPADQCDQEGYPNVWKNISKQVRSEANAECSMCGKAYLLPEFKCALTVHHINRDKADCRRHNLESICWTCHVGAEHSPSYGLRERYCRYCKGWFKSWVYLHQHLVGKHQEAIERKRKVITDAEAFYRQKDIQGVPELVKQEKENE